MGYIGEIQATFILTKFADESKIYEVGDRCCQLVLVPFIRPDEIIIVDELEETERGDKGHGSSGS